MPDKTPKTAAKAKPAPKTAGKADRGPVEGQVATDDGGRPRTDDGGRPVTA